MNIAIVGATGLLGTPIVAEAVQRGHRVTALCRHPDQVAAAAGVSAVGCDVFDVVRLTQVLRGVEAVIHCYSPRRDHATDRKVPHRRATQAIIDACRAAGVPRLLAAGGAGSLEVAPGMRLMDKPGIPAMYLESAVSTLEVYALLQSVTDLDWTFLCPSAELDDKRGRTGVFRLGGSQLLRDEAGRSAISFEDYAVAMVDELEQPRHTGQRFTAGY